MINHIDSKITNLSIHHIGNKIEEEGIILSQKGVQLEDIKIEELLVHLLLANFKEPEFFNFTYTNGDFILNPIFNFCCNIFDNPATIHEQSTLIAKHLYESAIHTNTRNGDLVITHIDKVIIEDELLDAIVILKSETKDNFLKFDNSEGVYQVLSEQGIQLSKIDKACIILNTERDKGFKICNIGKSLKSKENRYWSDDFLNIAPRSDTYHHTKNQISLTKAFIKERLKPIKEIDKTEEIELLNRSQKFFTNNETFDEDRYKSKVFKDKDTIDAYQDYQKDYQEETDSDLKDNFKISPEAVKKQSRLFKSVLKLDKNFHIYIHGNRNLITKGVDSEGKKFYKVIYEEEN